MRTMEKKRKMNWKLNERIMYLFEETHEESRYLIVETMSVKMCVKMCVKMS